VTATGGIPTGGNTGTLMAANSINGVITTLVGKIDITGLAAQKSSVTGVGIQSKIGVKPNTASTGTELGVQTLGNIGIITLPAATPGNGLNDFVLNDRGCLPILALQTAPAKNVIRPLDADSNSAAYTIGGTCSVAVSDVGVCLVANVIPCTFGASTAGCLTGLAGASFTPTDPPEALGKNTASATSGTAQILTTGTTHVKQQKPTTASTGGAPLQLAYNPIIGTTGSAAGAISVPTGSSDLSWANLLANSQVNQAALDLAAVTVLFCVTSGVCCTTNACNTIPVVTTKSSSTSLNNNIIIILMSIICSMSF